MLVLLIVFMVTAPLLTSGLHIDLPEVQATNTPVKDAKLVVSITKDERILFGEDDVTQNVEKACSRTRACRRSTSSTSGPTRTRATASWRAPSLRRGSAGVTSLNLLVDAGGDAPVTRRGAA